MKRITERKIWVSIIFMILLAILVYAKILPWGISILILALVIIFVWPFFPGEVWSEERERELITKVAENLRYTGVARQVHIDALAEYLLDTNPSRADELLSRNSYGDWEVRGLTTRVGRKG